MAAHRRVMVDVSPLRDSREFRLLFTGQLVSYFGRQLTVVAIPYQVFLLTHSSLAVGMVGLVSVIPLVGFSLIGGSVADAVDRRKLLLTIQVLAAATSVGLALNAQRGRPALWVLYALSGVHAGLLGFDLPTRSAVVPNLICRDQLPAAAALNQIVFQVGGVAGPSLAGLLIARVSLSSAFWIDAVTFGWALVCVSLLPVLPPEGGGRRPGLASIGEGLRYLRGKRLLQSTFYIDINAMVFGMPRALFPALGTNVFHGGAGTVGLLYAAPGAGALVGALTSGWTGAIRRQGRAVIVSVAIWGAAIATFGLVPWLPLALAMLALAGAADVVSAVFRNTILQVTVPDELRGRLSAIMIAVVAGGPQVGDVEAGSVAALTSPRVSATSGGMACVVGAVVLAGLIPELDRYDALAPTLDDVAEGEGGRVGDG